jgi:hypothetical protein
MSRFIETIDGSFVPLHEIVKIKPDGKKHCIIKTRSGKRYTVCDSAYELTKITTSDTVCGIPAQPGYFVVEAVFGEEGNDDFETKVTPVVGWLSIDSGESVCIYESSPILAGLKSGLDPWALVWPDGRVAEPLGPNFQNVEKWLHHVKESVKKRRSSE